MQLYQFNAKSTIGVLALHAEQCSSPSDAYLDAGLFVEPVIMSLPFFGRVGQPKFESSENLGQQLVDFCKGDLAI